MATALRDAGVRQDEWAIRFIVAGENWGVWDKKTGGELDSDELKYSPGRMADQISLGGRVLPGNITIQRLYDRKDDHDRINNLLKAVGKAVCTVSLRPMDADANEYGKSVVYTARLKRVMLPDIDSEANAAALIECELTVTGRPAAI